MATDVMKLHPTPEEIITKHNLKFSRYFQNALTTKYMEFMDNTPSDIDPRLVTEVYLKMYQYAAYTFYPSESAYTLGQNTSKWLRPRHRQSSCYQQYV